MSISNLIGKVRAITFNYLKAWKNQVSKYYRKFYHGQHQLTSTTSIDRYPELFIETARIFEMARIDENVKILSFGCSTGEECFSIRKYFTNSTIIGADINKNNLARATSKNGDNRIHFVYSTTENLIEKGPYQIIFCLSVLCRWEDTRDVENCEKIYPFYKFQATVKELSDMLLPGGLMVVYNSNFAFEDADVFVQAGYEKISTPTVQNSGFVHKFSKDNNRVSDIHKACVYRKKLK
jgi:hypothetical protein